MKTIPISRPGAGPAPQANPAVQQAADRRASAIAILEGNSGQQPPQQSGPIPTNPNSVSVEELGSVKAQPLQNITNEEPSESKDVAVTTEEVRKVSKPAESELSSSQLAILARKERALRAQAQQQKQELQARETQWSQEKQELQNRLKELETGYIPKANLKQAALEALNKGELSYEEITQEIMNPMDSRVSATISRLEAQVNELQKKLDGAAKGAQEAQTQQYQAAIKQIERDVVNLVKVDPSFEMVKHTNSIKDVVELIEETYKQDGYVMSVEEAAQQVEDYLVEETSKLASVSKIQKRLGQSAPSVKKEEVQGQQKQTPNQSQTQKMKTLTNQAGASRQLTARERAVLAFRGELKS